MSSTVRHGNSMNIFRRLFGCKEEEQALPPINDSTLGELGWDSDTECWVGYISRPEGNVRILLASGSPQEYPPEEVREILREPYVHFEKYSKIALDYLRNSERPKIWKVNPDTFIVSGLEIWGESVDAGAYSFTFKDGDSGAIWSVVFEGAKPLRVNVDD